MFTKGCFIIISCIFFTISNAQKSNPVLKGYAFYQVNMPGLNKMDELGNSLNKIDTTYFIYLITKKNIEPKIEKVHFNYIVFHPSILRLNDTVIHIRKIKGLKNTVEIKTERGQTIWKLELQVKNTDRFIRPSEYNKFILVYQKKLHLKPFEIQMGLELEPDEHK